ncbi:glucose-6-phosphate isomerase [Sporosarcina newyorkensis]|uniref:glucose-6-phosphate isomerase n=1 Tax=Sporosarcina newyorkensis TaxID=759851 RepID=UPI0002F2C789|nr:glucose-6-phosphate isomerase [Sporosarcina newyorkensis]
MSYIKLDYSKATPFFGNFEMGFLQDVISSIHTNLLKESEDKKGSLGWLHLPGTHKNEEYEKIKIEAAKVRGNSEILLVIGIGGSYLGTRAGIELLNHSFHNYLTQETRLSPQVFFVGTNLSSTYISDLIELLKGKDFSINVVSKSGSSLETAIGFRIFKKILADKYGEEEAKSRIYITTDYQKGTLKLAAIEEGYKTFGIPEDIGGRFSVLTSVGLFPMAVSGICIDKVLDGANTAKMELAQRDINRNPAYQYAAVRNILYNKGKTIEILASFEPKFHYFSEWWKQLFAESEGKEGMGIFPSAAMYSTDLHSIGQYIQEGRRDLFETVIQIEKSEKEITMGTEPKNLDGLNYLSGKTVSFINEKALLGTVDAHMNGGVPNLVIRVPDICPFSFGYLVYFFQFACVISSHILGVNPFNQPGVEAYKNSMYSLLRQPQKLSENSVTTQAITY